MGGGGGRSKGLASPRPERSSRLASRLYSRDMRLIVAVAAAAFLSLASADAASAYRLCDKPAKVYRVVAVEKVSCRYAHRMADEYGRRFAEAFADGAYGPAPTRVWGWRRVAVRTGTYYGLFGTRTVWRRGAAKIRIDERGE